MLYYLFKCTTDLLSFNSCDYRSYIDTFQACQRLYSYLDDFYTDLQEDKEAKNKDKDKGAIVDKDKLLTDFFKAFAYYCLRGKGNDDLMYSFTDDLSRYKLNCVYNQTLYIGRDLTTINAQEQFKL